MSANDTNKPQPIPCEWLNKVGRPRTTSPQPDEAHELGKDLVQWATESTNQRRTAWSFWYALRHGMIRDHWRDLVQLPEFRPYYEVARAALANKLHNEELEKGMAHRYIRFYERDMAENEDKDACADIKRKTNAMKDIAPELIQANAQFNDFLNERRKKSS